MDTFYIALSDAIKPLNTSKLFRKWMDLHFSRKVVEVGILLPCRGGVGWRGGWGNLWREKYQATLFSLGGCGIDLFCKKSSFMSKTE